MSFAYGSQNRFYDQIVASSITIGGDYGPVLAGGDTNGALALVVTCTSGATVSSMTLSYKEAATETGSYTVPTNADKVTFGGTTYAAGDEVGALILPNGCKDFVKATIGGTISAGAFACHLQYLAR